MSLIIVLLDLDRTYEKKKKDVQPLILKIAALLVLFLFVSIVVLGGLFILLQLA
jgi:hypothetical protein